MKQSIVEKINSEFARRQSINARYSLRAYAVHMGISVSLLSRIMNEKIPMTPKLLQRMSVPLALTPEEYENYESEISKRKNIQSSEKVIDSNQRQLQHDEFEVIQHWYNFVILEMVSLDTFRPDEKWIAKKIDISEDAAFMALERLVRMGLLIQNPDKSFKKSTNFVSILQMNFSTVAMRARQRQVLERAIVALELVDFQKRDQSAITISLDSSLLPEIKTKIKKMRRSLANYISKNSKKCDQVYELSVSFFPWSQ